MQEFVRRRPGVPVYLVDVLSQGPLSRHIAASLGIRHESPQVILLQAGTPRWHASHYEVTAAAIAKAITHE